MPDFGLLLTLFFEFFKTGLFALGGGLATIPFLYEMMEKYHWFSQQDLMNMIAVSESTPGPMGVNMATYVGFHASGNSIIGALTTTIGLVAPSVIIICIIARMLEQFRDSHWVQDIFYGLRPAVSAMIASAGIGVLIATLFPQAVNLTGISWIHLGLFVLFFIIAMSYKKLHPILLICICAALGVILKL